MPHSRRFIIIILSPDLPLGLGAKIDTFHVIYFLLVGSSMHERRDVGSIVFPNAPVGTFSQFMKGFNSLWIREKENDLGPVRLHDFRRMARCMVLSLFSCLGVSRFSVQWNTL